ncbi:hypothetical protein LCGC14_2271390, partial [marine sediment metagenome]
AVRKNPLGTDLAIKLDGEKRPRLIPVDRVVGHTYGHVRRGYAYTTHKLQGSTVDRAFVHVGGAMTNMQMAYVQGSRHRKTLQLYTDQHEAGIALTNLARLRQILPHCDVLLVTTTQQKYRSARVADELAAAASGARLVFVQTHADVDEDIREDWTDVLGKQYATGHVFLVDLLEVLADALGRLAPRGEFAGLVDLLTRQLAGKAAARIRRANFLDLVEETLASCRTRIEAQMASVGQVGEAVQEQRSVLAARLADQMRSELLTSRRQWENRLLGQVASRWGLSPFSLVLRVFQGLGSLLAARLSRNDEYEADAYAAALLTKAGIGIGPQISLFEKLDALSQSGGNRPPAWLLSHPKTEERIDKLRQMQLRWDG